MTTTEDMIGRRNVDDLEAILSIANTDVDEAIHTVTDSAEAIFTWDYEKGQRPALNRLYEKAKTSQWPGVDRRLAHRSADLGVRAIISYTLTPADDPPEDVAEGIARILVSALQPEEVRR